MPPKRADIEEIGELYPTAKANKPEKGFKNSGNPVAHIRFVQWHREPKPETYYTEARGVSALIYQAELCPKTGRFHYQGYFQFEDKMKKRLDTIRSWNPIRYFHVIDPELEEFVEVDRDEEWHFVTGAFIGLCNGTPEQNIAYCSKEESREPGATTFRRGIFRGDAKKLDARVIAQQILDGEFDEHANIDNAIFLAKNKRVVDELRRIKLDRETRERDFSDTKLYILFGASGAGKTYDAKYGIWKDGEKIAEDRKNKDYFLVSDYFVSNGVPLFDKYSGQSRLIIDEADKRRNFPIDWVINACSDEVFECPCRGNGTKLRGWTEIFIIINQKPSRFFKTIPGSEALIRRVSGVKHYPVQYSDRIQELTDRTWEDLTAKATIKKEKKRKQIVDDDESCASNYDGD